MSVLDRFRLDGRRAMITGGSRGLGKEMARALAEAAADLVLVGRDPGTLGATAESLRAADWAPYNVTVNAIAASGFMTDISRGWFRDNPALKVAFESQVPMGRLGEPSEIGPLTLYLASDASSYMTGSVVFLDGGYTVW